MWQYHQAASYCKVETQQFFRMLSCISPYCKLCSIGNSSENFIQPHEVVRTTVRIRKTYGLNISFQAEHPWIDGHCRLAISDVLNNNVPHLCYITAVLTPVSGSQKSLWSVHNGIQSKKSFHWSEKFSILRIFFFAGRNMCPRLAAQLWTSFCSTSLSKGLKSKISAEKQK